MVQVLPYVPSFGENLVGKLEAAGGEALQGYMQGRARTQLDKLLNPQAQQQASNQVQPGAQGENGQVMGEQVPQQAKKPLSPMELVNVGNLARKAYGKEGSETLVKGLIHQQDLDSREQLQEKKFEHKLQEAELKPFIEQIASDKESLPKSVQASQQVIDAIINGNVGPTSMASIGNIAKDLGVPQSITKMLESPDSKEFNNGIKALMGQTIKDTFRGTTTQREIDIANSMQAEIGVRPEANLAAAWAVQSDLDLRSEKVRLYNEAVEKNVPITKRQIYVEKKLEPFRQKLSDDYFEAITELRGK